MKHFAIVGVAGYIAPRHLQAVHNTGNRVVAAIDPIDSVGILDKYSLEIEYFNDFDAFITHAKHSPTFSQGNLHYVTICSPNYLHYHHCKASLELGADVICEKPLVIDPVHLDFLKELEFKTKHK